MIAYFIHRFVSACHLIESVCNVLPVVKEQQELLPMVPPLVDTVVPKEQPEVLETAASHDAVHHGQVGLCLEGAAEEHDSSCPGLHDAADPMNQPTLVEHAFSVTQTAAPTTYSVMPALQPTILMMRIQKVQIT